MYLFFLCLQNAVKENHRLKETQEKIRKAKESKEKSEKDKKEKALRQKKLIDMTIGK